MKVELMNNTKVSSSNLSDEMSLYSNSLFFFLYFIYLRINDR